jgi:hypothetical protein
MNRTWKTIFILYSVFTAPLVYLGLYFAYYFLWMHHMFIIGFHKPFWLH